MVSWVPPGITKRIDGGISDPRTPSSPHRRTLARVWTALQGRIRPSICTLRILSGPRGAVYPIAASRRLLSVEPVVAGAPFPPRRLDSNGVVGADSSPCPMCS
jgi:hypothetical protein